MSPISRDGHLSESPADKAGVKYWEALWRSAKQLPPVSARRTYPERQFEIVLRRVLSRSAGQRLIEPGCARSTWLPFFANELGLRVTGIDYSPTGCDQARHLLAASGTTGEVVEADFFEAPSRLRGNFDLVVSMGVVEHFEDTVETLRSFARFLRPGGRILTFIPNLSGAIGTVQKLLNRKIYDIHVPLNREALRDAHLQAGFDVDESTYLVSTHFGVCNLTGSPPGFGLLSKQLVLTALERLSMSAWFFEQRTVKLPASQMLSGYVFCSGTLPVAPRTLSGLG